MEREKFVRRLENTIKWATQRMDEAQRKGDTESFNRASMAWQQASLLWLEAAQGMSREKAAAVMIGFATGGELAKWVDERRPGPPPSVLSLYPPYDPKRRERDDER
ncbi:hypothetical protein KSC_021920 [Ktedonobacter sp. SOSP1-52]|nr:hypothetical protein KSC_021920 [Ktedonobacter sp. SOSP1-52]